MKLNYFLIIFITLITFNSYQSYSQHIKLDKKALSFLTETEKVNVIFSYSGLMIDGDLTEEEFLHKINIKIIKHANVEEANRWDTSYKKHKDSIWGNAFLKILNERNKNFKNNPIFVTNSKDTKYTMKVNAEWMYYGYDAGIVDRPAKVTLHIAFIKTKEQEFTKVERQELSRYK